MSDSHGFTLLEMLIVVVTIVVLTRLSTPELQHIVRKQEGKNALRTVAELLVLARSTAVTRNQIVTLCHSLDGRTCSGNWTSGSIVFTDRNGDREVNQDDQVLRIQLNESMRGSIVWRAFQNRQYLQIDAFGFLRHQSGNFLYCPNGGDARLARQLIVNATGRFRYAVDSNGDNIREDSNGKPLQC